MSPKFLKSSCTHIANISSRHKLLQSFQSFCVFKTDGTQTLLNGHRFQVDCLLSCCLKRHRNLERETGGEWQSNFLNNAPMLDSAELCAVRFFAKEPLHNCSGTALILMCPHWLPAETPGGSGGQCLGPEALKGSLEHILETSHCCPGILLTLKHCAKEDCHQAQLACPVIVLQAGLGKYWYSFLCIIRSPLFACIWAGGVMSHFASSQESK